MKAAHSRFMMRSFYTIAVLAIYQPFSGALPMEALSSLGAVKFGSESKNLGGSRSFANSFSIVETPNTELQGGKNVQSQPFWAVHKPETQIHTPLSKVEPTSGGKPQETHTSHEFPDARETSEQEKHSLTEAKLLEKKEPPTQNPSVKSEDSAKPEFFDAPDDFIEGEKLLNKGPKPLDIPESQEFKNSYHEFLSGLSFKPSVPEKVRNLLGKAWSYIPDESRWKSLKGYDQNWISEARKETQYRLDPFILSRFEKKISGSQRSPYTLLKVDPSDPEPLTSLMAENVESYRWAYDYFLRKFGHDEMLRRVEVSNYQHAQFEILKNWDREVTFIADHLDLPKSEVEEAGKLFGAGAFPVFEGMDPEKTLNDLEKLKNTFGKFSLYENWKDFIGDEEFSRRLSLLKTLFTTGYQRIDPEQLSAWQMQGLDVGRMLTLVAHSKAKKNELSIAETVLKGENEELKEHEIRLFLGGFEGNFWQNKLEHEQLLLSLPQPRRLQYNKVRNIVIAEQKSAKTKPLKPVEEQVNPQGSGHVDVIFRKQVDAKPGLLRWVKAVLGKVLRSDQKVSSPRRPWTAPVLQKLRSLIRISIGKTKSRSSTALPTDSSGSQHSGSLARKSDGNVADGHPSSHSSADDKPAPPTGPSPTAHRPPASVHGELSPSISPTVHQSLPPTGDQPLI